MHKLDLFDIIDSMVTVLYLSVESLRHSCRTSCPLPQPTQQQLQHLAACARMKGSHPSAHTASTAWARTCAWTPPLAANAPRSVTGDRELSLMAVPAMEPRISCLPASCCCCCVSTPRCCRHCCLPNSRPPFHHPPRPTFPHPLPSPPPSPPLQAQVARGGGSVPSGSPHALLWLPLL